MASTFSVKRSRLAAMAAGSTQAAPARPRLPIRNVTAHAVKEPSGARQYLLVRIDTEGGPSGYGETAAADAQTRLDTFRSLVGQDALASQTVDAHLVRAHAPAGTRAAVNMALLDILGKVAKAPVYEVLAGPTRHKARALAPLHGADRATLIRSLERARARGFRAFLVEVQIPAGPVRGREFFRTTLDLLTSLRAAGGAGAEDFVLDCGSRTTAAEASSLAAAFEGFHLLWLDEPAGRINDEMLLKISRESVTPLGWGRRVAGNDGFQNLLRLQAIDVLRPDLAVHPMAGIRKAAALAEAYYTAFAPYHAGGPLATAAALHVAASTPNFVIQQVPLPPDDRDLAMREELAGKGLEVPSDGFLELPSRPGLGVEINEDAVRKYAA
jgi:galactonate dehydratase